MFAVIASSSASRPASRSTKRWTRSSLPRPAPRTMRRARGWTLRDVVHDRRRCADRRRRARRSRRRARCSSSASCDARVVGREQDVPAARDVERHRAALAVIVADDEHAQALGRLVDAAATGARRAATSALHSAGGSISRMPSAGSGRWPRARRRRSPRARCRARGSIERERDARAEREPRRGVEAHADLGDVARAAHGDLAAEQRLSRWRRASMRYRGARRDTVVDICHAARARPGDRPQAMTASRACSRRVRP